MPAGFISKNRPSSYTANLRAVNALLSTALSLDNPTALTMVLGAPGQYWLDYGPACRNEPLILGEPDDVIVPSNFVLWLDADISPYFAASDYEPPTSWTIFDGTTTHLVDDPLIIDSGLLADLGGNPTSLLWTDSARCPQTISTLLVIGV